MTSSMRRKTASIHQNARPIASGRVDPTTGGDGGAILGAMGLIAAWRLNTSFFETVVAYLAINVLYSTFLKRIALVDVFVVASGFCYG